MTPAGFPHSDIHGSRPAFGYPWLFVDRYVLLRLPVPRHPPCALLSLTCQQLLAVVFANHARITFLWVLISFHSRTLQFNAWVFLFCLFGFTFFLFLLYSVFKVPLRGRFRLLCAHQHSVRYFCPCRSFEVSLCCAGDFAYFVHINTLYVTFALAGFGFCRISPAPAGGGLKWTRTTDLTLIRRAL